MKRIRTSISALFLVYCLVLAGCSKADLNRVINILDGVPALVTSFQLPDSTAKSIVSVFSDITSAVRVYRDDPTEDKYQKALNVFDSPGVQHALSQVTNPTWRARLQGIVGLSRTIFSAFGPGTAAEMSKDSEDAKAARKELEQKIKRLEELVKP